MPDIEIDLITQQVFIPHIKHSQVTPILIPDGPIGEQSLAEALGQHVQNRYQLALLPFSNNGGDMKMLSMLSTLIFRQGQGDRIKWPATQDISPPPSDLDTAETMVRCPLSPDAHCPDGNGFLVQRMATSKAEGQKAMLPGVTVIVPVRNAQKTIDKCINALLKQDYPQDKLQIIIADNGSTDKHRKSSAHSRLR